MASRVIDRSDLLARLSDVHAPRPQLSRADVFQHPADPRHDAAPRMAQHPRNVRLLPRSRDFH
jgi:error-prone DNA polymerase